MTDDHQPRLIRFGRTVTALFASSIALVVTLMWHVQAVAGSGS